MEPTKAHWLALYEAAASFKKAAVWNWMQDVHLFGVKHPDYPQVGYCSVLGRAGEMYGLAVYLGTAGLHSVLELMDGAADEDPMLLQDCLMLSFDDREELHPMEMERIQELGLKYRGRQAWPSFRRYEPGYYPWPIQRQEEAGFLTEVIGQALEVARAAQADPDEYLAWEADRFLTRVGTREAGGRIVWTTEWRAPEPVSAEASDEPKRVLVDELRLAKLKKHRLPRAGAWEVGCFFMPQPYMGEDGRPVFPLLFLVVEQASGKILTVELSSKGEMAERAAAKFLELLETTRQHPAELLALKAQPLEYLAPIIQALELPCSLAESLPSLEEAQAGLAQQMG